jgi:hypothetical protein
MIHKDLTPEKWFQCTLFEQLANVGCDISRTIEWRKKGDIDYANRSFDRALELLDLTISDPKNKGATRKELVRTREVLIDYFLYHNEYNTSDAIWHEYFLDFNFAAAIARGK